MFCTFVCACSHVGYARCYVQTASCCKTSSPFLGHLAHWGSAKRCCRDGQVLQWSICHPCTVCCTKLCTLSPFMWHTYHMTWWKMRWIKRTRQQCLKSVENVQTKWYILGAKAKMTSLSKTIVWLARCADISLSVHIEISLYIKSFVFISLH